MATVPGSFTPEELRLLAVSDRITDWQEDQARTIRSREAMAKARAAKVARRLQERVRRVADRDARLAAIVAQRAQERQRRNLLRLEHRREKRAPRAKVPDTRLRWVDRTLLARLPATLLDLEEHLRSMDATKLPRVIEERMHRLVTLGLVAREPIAEGSSRVSDVRWTPTETPVRKDRCA